MEKAFDNIAEARTLNRAALEKISTENLKSVYLGDHLLLCKILGRYKIYLDSRDVGIASNILMDGYWESWVTKFIIESVQPGDVCIDAGANFGYYSLLLAELTGKEGRAVAIEPNAYLSKLLSFTSKVNDHAFTVVQKALSDEAGEVTLSVPLHFWGGGTIRKEKVDDHFTTESVRVDTLDNIAMEMDLKKVDFIKMDCEGVEPMIFQGMKNILARNPQIRIVMEYSPFMYPDARAFTEYLFANFSVGEITSDSTIRSYSEDEMSQLLELKDHIDLFLVRK